jgi:hypothetical protein
MALLSVVNWQPLPQTFQHARRLDPLDREQLPLRIGHGRCAPLDWKLEDIDMGDVTSSRPRGRSAPALGRGTMPPVPNPSRKPEAENVRDDGNDIVKRAGTPAGGHEWNSQPLAVSRAKASSFSMPRATFMPWSPACTRRMAAAIWW